MKNPRIVVDRTKLRENISFIVAKLKEHDLTITAVTKVFNAHSQIIALYEEFTDIIYFGDSRIKFNELFPLKKAEDFDSDTDDQ
ncbi:hypothetical protein ABW365_05900 [Enterococcus avium]